MGRICQDGLDYRKLYAEYLRSWRKIDPAILFEVVVLAYMHGEYSSREIEDLCRNDISVSQTMLRLKRKATERINRERGIILRQNRSVQVEGAFGVLKEDFGFRRFLARGKAKTETQFFILAIAFNVQKLWNRENSKRFNMFLFSFYR